MEENLKAKVLRLFNAGLTTQAIAESAKIPMPAVTAILVREGKVKNEKRLIDDPDLRRQVLAAYRQGMPMQTICTKYGLLPRQIWLILAEEGEPVRRHIAETAIALDRRDAEIADLYLHTAMSATAIAAACGISRTVVYDILRRHGIKYRRPSYRKGYLPDGQSDDEEEEEEA